jgi:hypothetical protein
VACDITTPDGRAAALAAKHFLLVDSDRVLNLALPARFSAANIPDKSLGKNRLIESGAYPGTF